MVRVRPLVGNSISEELISKHGGFVGRNRRYKAVSIVHPVVGAPVETANFDASRVTTIAIGHWVHDSYTAFLAPLPGHL